MGGRIRAVADAISIVGPVVICIEGLLWPDELKALASFQWSWPGAILVTSTAAVAVIAGVGIWDRKREETESSRLAALRDNAHSVAARVHRELPSLSPDARLRLVLWAIADAIQKFVGNSVRCGANVMTFSSTRPPTVKFEGGYEVKGYLTLRRSGSTAC